MTSTPSSHTSASRATEEVSAPLVAPSRVIQTVTGHPRELVDLTKALLQDDTWRCALISIAPTASTEVAVRFSKTKEISLTQGAREISIEIPQSVKINHVGQALPQAIAREFTVTTLAQIARHVATPSEAPRLLLDLVERVSRKRPHNDRELSLALCSLLQPVKKDLQSLSSECAKRASRRASLKVTDTCHTSLAIDEVFDQLARLRALAWLSQDSRSLEKFDETGRQCAQAIQSSLNDAWENALNIGNPERAAIIVQIYNHFLDSLRKCAFSSQCPSWIPSEREQRTPTTIEQRAALLRRGAPSIRASSRQSAFVTELIAQLPDYLAGLAATATLESEIRGWIPPKENATHSINVDLLEAVTEVVRDLPSLKAIPAVLPESMKRFVECVGRLKHHGGVEGLEMHCIIVAPGAWLDSMKKERPVEGGRLHRELESSAHANIREYLNLVELVATWPCRSSDVRAQIVSHFYERVVTTVARAVLTSVGEATYMIYSVLSKSHAYDEMSPKLSYQRLLDLAVAADSLRSLVRHPELSQSLLEAAVTALPNLAVARRVLELSTMRWPEILKHTNDIPTSFDDSLIGSAMRAFCVDIQAGIEAHIRREMHPIEVAYDRGDVKALTQSARSAMILIEALGATDKNRERVQDIVDSWLIKYINLARLGFADDLGSHEFELGADSVTESSRIRAAETVDSFMNEIRPLYQFFSQYPHAIRATLLEHYHQTVEEIVQRYPLTIASYIDDLLVKSSREDEAERAGETLAFVRSLPGISV